MLRSAVPDDGFSKNTPVNFRSYFEANEPFPSNLMGSDASVPDDASAAPSNDDDSANEEIVVITSMKDEIDKADEGNELRMSIDTSNLLGFSYVFPNDGVDMRNTVKEVDEDTDEVTVEDLNCQQTKVDYNKIINMLNKREEDGDELWRSSKS